MPQLDPFGRPLSAQSASRLGVEQAGRISTKLIAAAIALVLAGAAAVIVVAATRKRTHAPIAKVATVTAAPKPLPEPKLLRPKPFSAAFSAGLATADKRSHGALDAVTIDSRQVTLSFQPKAGKALMVTVDGAGQTHATTLHEQHRDTHAFSRTKVQFAAPEKIATQAAQVMNTSIGAMSQISLVAGIDSLEWVVVIGGKYLHGTADGNLIT